MQLLLQVTDLNLQLLEMRLQSAMMVLQQLLLQTQPKQHPLLLQLHLAQQDSVETVFSHSVTMEGSMTDVQSLMETQSHGAPQMLLSMVDGSTVRMQAALEFQLLLQNKSVSIQPMKLAVAVSNKNYSMLK